jgi:arsenate reductase
LDQPWDDVITVCDEAEAACPALLGGIRRRHWSFPDPARATGSEAEQLAVYRAVRDAIGARVAAFVREVEAAEAASAPERGGSSVHLVS